MSSHLSPMYLGGNAECATLGSTPPRGKADAAMSEHEEHTYGDGYRAAQADDRGNLLRALHGMTDTGELDVNVARDLFTAVYGAVESEREFGPDPRIDNIIKGMF